MAGKLSEHVSAVSPLGEAIDGAPRAGPRKPRSAPVLREVTSGIVCFCGEQFTEAQAIEFMRHLREEFAYDLEVLDRTRARWRRDNQKQMDKPEQRERHRIRDNARHRERYAKDAAYRERHKAQTRRRKGQKIGAVSLAKDIS